MKNLKISVASLILLSSVAMAKVSSTPIAVTTVKNKSLVCADGKIVLSTSTSSREISLELKDFQTDSEILTGSADADECARYEITQMVKTTEIRCIVKSAQSATKLRFYKSYGGDSVVDVNGKTFLCTSNAN